jgi:hypothetical protein
VSRWHLTNKEIASHEVGRIPFHPIGPPDPILLVGGSRHKPCSRHETIGNNTITPLRLVVVLVDGQ